MNRYNDVQYENLIMKCIVLYTKLKLTKKNTEQNYLLKVIIWGNMVTGQREFKPTV